jgi:hypothetical protein
VQAFNFGTRLYREGEFGLSAARELRPLLSLGIGLQWRWLQIEGYAPSHLMAVTAGLLLRPAKSFRLGAVWRDLNRPRLPGYLDRVTDALTVGAAAEVGAGATVTADVVQERRHSAELRFGAEARLLPQLRLRVGGRAEPVRPSAGFQVDAGSWSFFYAGDLHPDLGPSHEAGMAWRFKP